jgi:uncharacterized protein (DUF2336 family)
VLLRIATDRFVNDPAPSPETIARYEKEALDLILSCDPATRLIVARKIAPRLSAPPALFDAIIERGGEAALVVLERAVAVRREQLIAAGAGDLVRACAVARRSDLDEELVGLLAARPAREIALALVGNPAAPLGREILAMLAGRADRDEKLAQALLARSAAPLDLAALFLYATSSQRAAMLLAAQRAELARSSPAWRWADGAAAKLERHALARQPALFASTLAQALGCEADLAERIVAEPSGEALTVALAALGAPEDATMRILVLGDAVSLDYRRLGALTRLKDALNPAAARRIVSAMTGARVAPRAIVEPALDPTAAPAPSRPAGAEATKTDAPQILRRRRAFQLALSGRREA